MKKHLSIALFAIAAVFVFSLSACKKEKTTQEKLVGKWTTKSYSYKHYENDILKIEDLKTASPGDYIEFKNNNTWISSTSGRVDSGNYNLIGSSTLQVQGMEFHIELLTKTDCSLVSRSHMIIGSKYTSETRISLIK